MLRGAPAAQLTFMGPVMKLSRRFAERQKTRSCVGAMHVR